MNGRNPTNSFNVSSVVIGAGVGILCGMVFGGFAGAITLSFVDCVAYGCSAALGYELIFGGFVGAVLGAAIGFLSGVINRGWRFALPIGIVTAATSIATLSILSNRDFRPGISGYVLTGIIGTVAGSLISATTTAIHGQITIPTEDPARG